MNILVAGVSDGSFCGVQDHAAVLSNALGETGLTVTTVWLDAASGVARATRLGHELYRRCQEVRPAAVLLHYSVFSFSYRGVPAGVPALAACLWRLGIPVVLFAHEFAYPWGRRGWRGAVHAATQRVALAPLFFASAAVIVTTVERVCWLRTRRWLPRRPVVFIPVFSNISPSESAHASAKEPGRIGLFSFGAEGLAVDIVIGAVADVARRCPDAHLVLIGGPGPESPTSEQWRRAANAAGCRVAFTGVVEEVELSRQLAACEIIVFADPVGPSSRKTSLAAALAHGLAVVALDGPQSWRELIDCGGVVVVEPQVQALSNALGRLLADNDARADVGLRGQALYEAELAPEWAAQRVRKVLFDTQGPRWRRA